VKLRPVPAATGGLLLEDSLAAGLAQGFDLGGGVLVVGLGDTCVTDQNRKFSACRALKKAAEKAPLHAKLQELRPPTRFAVPHTL
jgi:hypothetical protein